jgi:hypothetical protein
MVANPPNLAAGAASAAPRGIVLDGAQLLPPLRDERIDAVEHNIHGRGNTIAQVLFVGADAALTPFGRFCRRTTNPCHSRVNPHHHWKVARAGRVS